MNSHSKKSFLSYENLEERKLLAGDVSVVESGQLFIRGDELSNQIAIVADESGQVTVTGLRDTTINGSSEPFVVSGAINLHGEHGRNASFAGGLRIMTFAGNDRIDIQGIELGDASRIVTGEGDDFVRFIRSTSRDEFMVTTDSGHDTLNFVQTRVHGDFDVRTNDGEDSIRIRNSRTWGSTDVRSGAGDDNVILNRVRFTGELQNVMTQDGSDQIQIRNNNVSDSGLNVYAGEGRDHVFAEMNLANEIDGEILIAGQDGFDVLDLDVDEAMEDLITHSGFVSGESAEGAWYAYDRGDSTATPTFNYWATAVEFAETTTIGSIDWLGSYFGSESPDTDNFVIEIFESEAIESIGGGYWFTQPTAEAAARFDIGNEANRADTGEEWREPAFNEDSSDQVFEAEYRRIFSYSAEIDFEFSADETYFVSVYSLTDADPDPAVYLNDNDFGVLLDYPGEPGEARPYVQPSGTQADPFQNTNAVLFDDNADTGLDPSRWHFSSAEIRTLVTLNP